MIVPRGFEATPGTMLPVRHIRVVMAGGGHYHQASGRWVEGHDHVHVHPDYDNPRRSRISVCGVDLATCEPAMVAWVDQQVRSLTAPT